jgi:dipeptidyl aminopeptidase/acylaminoacyl peptidase
LADSDHRFEAHYTWSLVGPLETEQDRARYHERSPVAWIDTIISPLLLLHGDADPVVPVEHSRRLVASLEALGAPIEYHEFAGEGHGWRDPSVRRLDLELSVAFLDRICRA